MDVKTHPDYPYEEKRLAMTIAYIDEILGATEGNKDRYKANIRLAMEELDFLDSSQSYINILTNAKFMQMEEKHFGNLSRVRNQPYFCRVDITPEDAEKPSKLYIGKTSLFRQNNQQPVIIDWRSPIANLYYEGQIGPVSYESAEGTVKGEMQLKRQYSIDGGNLLDFRDVDVTARDELLQNSLSTGSDRRLKDIVATIQAEQNRVIRADMYKPLIVQGVAGSGKTTIALHRIAYLIYSHAEHFCPDQFMILAPNRLFLNHISEVLPELGVDAVVQTTFPEFVQQCIGAKWKMINPEIKLVSLLQSTTREGMFVEWASQFKGSMDYKNLLDHYFEVIVSQILPETDFRLRDQVIYSAQQMKKLLINDYRYLPLYKRLEQMKKVLASHLKSRMKEVLDDIANHYDDLMESVRFQYRSLEERRPHIMKLMDEKEAAIAATESEAKQAVNRFMERFPKFDVFHYYKELFAKHSELFKPFVINTSQWEYLQRSTLGLSCKKQYEIQDTAGLLYLQHLLFGSKHKLEIRNVVIDEGQDFSVFQIYSISKVLDTNLFTILGDLSQGIHSYRGLQDWEQLSGQVFGEEVCQMVVLKQSYRTTIEIMTLANEVIQHGQTTGTVLAEPVVRHGDQPLIRKFDDDTPLLKELAKQLEKLRSEGIVSVALISKTMQDAKKTKAGLERISKLSFSIMDGKDPLKPNVIPIIPSYTVKGLEFDAVCIVNLDESYSQAETDLKLLYVAMTRPLHKLFIYTKKGKIPLLERLD